MAYIEEVDKIIIEKPIMEGIDIEGNKNDRTLILHGQLDKDNRFRLKVIGDFKIIYETRKNKDKKSNIVYSEWEG